MNAPVLFLINLLKNRVFINDKVVPLINRSYPTEKLPCLTIDQSGGSLVLDKYIKHTPNEVLFKEVETTVKIHVWCTKEEERENILSQIKDCNNKCFMDHYSYCTKYNNGICKTLNHECKAMLIHNARTAKKQCPEPENLEYENMFTRFNIDKFNYCMNPYYHIDDYTSKQRTLHTVIPVEFVYTEAYDNNGLITERIIIKEKIN